MQLLHILNGQIGEHEINMPKIIKIFLWIVPISCALIIINLWLSFALKEPLSLMSTIWHTMSAMVFAGIFIGIIKTFGKEKTNEEN